VNAPNALLTWFLRHSVVPETADAELLSMPLRSIADVEEIEKVPLEERLKVTNFSQRIDLALAAHDPDDVAITYVEDGDINGEAQQTSFRDLRRNINQTAALLRGCGVNRGDVVAVFLPAVPGSFWAYLGAMSAGIVFPVNWMLEADQLSRLLREAKVKAVIALGPTPGFKIWESLSSIRPELPEDVAVWSVPGPKGERLPATDLDTAVSGQPEARPFLEATGDDIAAYVHSGGTTGAPKIVKLSHRGLSYRHWTIQLFQRQVLRDICLHDTPMFHVGGFIGRTFSALASGGSMVIPSVMGARDRRYIADYWKFAEKYRLSRLSAVPTTLAVLAKNPPRGRDLSALKPYFATGSASLPIAVREEFQRHTGIRVLNTYGMTENTASVSCDPPDGTIKEGGSGIRFPYTEVRAAEMDSEGHTLRVCGPNEIGMLQIRGPGLTPGYLNPAHERGARTEDGWIISGDLGRVDEDGCIFVTGRAKDVIIRSGHNIDPALIEEPLMKCPDVQLVAAVGKPDAYAGELPVAYVQLVSGSNATASDLAEFLKDRIAERAAFPKEIVILKEIPLTAVGKPLKAELRKDAVRRAINSALSEATGLAIERLSVSSDTHPVAGTMLNIRISCLEREWIVLEPRAREAMKAYSLAYSVAREDVPDLEGERVRIDTKGAAVCVG
jgi:fatty-acyl-CoA synthase